MFFKEINHFPNYDTSTFESYLDKNKLSIDKEQIKINKLILNKFIFLLLKYTDSCYEFDDFKKKYRLAADEIQPVNGELQKIFHFMSGYAFSCIKENKISFEVLENCVASIKDETEIQNVLNLTPFKNYVFKVSESKKTDKKAPFDNDFLKL